jgi:hypothetical protein
MPAPRQFQDRVGDRWVNLDRYYKKIQIDPVTNCHNWTGVVSSIGYGFVAFRSAVNDSKTGMMTAHRLALMIKLGREIAPKMNANHFHCHNRLCCNPDHISEGTQQDKIQQMIADGIKTGRAPGQLVGAYLHQQYNRSYKYSEAEIQWIRNAPTAEIAAKYGVTHQRAGNMKGAFRKGYRWLPYEKINRKPGKKPKIVDIE